MGSKVIAKTNKPTNMDNGAVKSSQIPSMNHKNVSNIANHHQINDRGKAWPINFITLSLRLINSKLYLINLIMYQLP